jgi:hypothetical protein
LLLLLMLLVPLTLNSAFLLKLKMEKLLLSTKNCPSAAHGLVIFLGDTTMSTAVWRSNIFPACFLRCHLEFFIQILPLYLYCTPQL